MAKFKMPSMKTLTGKGLPAIGGALGSKVVKNLAKKVIKKPEMQKFIPAVPMLVGMMLSEQKGALEYFGIGMMASAGGDLAGQFVPALAGLEDVDLSGIFDETVSDDMSNDLSDDLNGPLDDDVSGPIDYNIGGASEEYADDY